MVNIVFEDEENKPYQNIQESYFFDEPDTSAQDKIGLNTGQLDTFRTKHSPSLNTRYKFIKKLSDGSASKLYIAEDLVSSQKVVIKKISKREEWKTELKLLKLAKKANAKLLLQYFDFFENMRFAFIITSLHKGFDLLDHVSINIPYDEKYAKKVFIEMSRCLKECHDLGIAHLDIKCENYIKKTSLAKPDGLLSTSLNKDIDLILIDFGHSEMSSYKITKGDSHYGTVYYICPEGYHRFYSMYSDIWSLGICYYMMLAKDYPFAGYDNDDVYYNNVYSGRIRFSKEIPEKALEIIKWCLNYDPRLRPTIDQLLEHEYFNET